MGILFLIGSQDDARGSDGEERAVGDDAALAVAEYLVVDKGASVARTVAQDVFQPSLLVAADVDDAVGDVNAGVHGLNRTVHSAVLLVAANDVVAHAQGDDLLEVEDVLNDYD